jgi:hypothetical protein
MRQLPRPRRLCSISSGNALTGGRPARCPTRPDLAGSRLILARGETCGAAHGGETTSAGAHPGRGGGAVRGAARPRAARLRVGRPAPRVGSKPIAASIWMACASTRRRPCAWRREGSYDRPVDNAAHCPRGPTTAPMTHFAEDSGHNSPGRNLRRQVRVKPCSQLAPLASCPTCRRSRPRSGSGACARGGQTTAAAQ